MAQLARQARNAEFLAGLSRLQVPDSVDGIERFVRCHFRYQPEGFEIIRTPLFMLAELETQGWFSGDCDDVSTFTAAVLFAFGHPAVFIAIRYQHQTEFGHVFVKSGSFVLDATVPYGTEYRYLEQMTVGV